jgi:hypothetical protein
VNNDDKTVLYYNHIHHFRSLEAGGGGDGLVLMGMIWFGFALVQGLPWIAEGIASHLADFIVSF